MKTNPQYRKPLKIQAFGKHGSLLVLSDGTNWTVEDPAELRAWQVGDDVFLWPGSQDIPTSMLFNITRFDYVDADGVAVTFSR